LKEEFAVADQYRHKDQMFFDYHCRRVKEMSSDAEGDGPGFVVDEQTATLQHVHADDQISVNSQLALDA